MTAADVRMDTGLPVSSSKDKFKISNVSFMEVTPLQIKITREGDHTIKYLY